MDDKYIVRVATNNDMHSIFRWLMMQDIGKEQTFLWNWRSTEVAWRQDEIFVCIDTHTNEAIAYIYADFYILNVKLQERGKGIGKMLVSYAMNWCDKNGVDEIKIECSPKTSIPFWIKMGFTIEGNIGKYIF